MRPQQWPRARASSSESLSRTDAEPHRRDPRALLQRLGADAEQDLEAGVALAHRGHAEIRGQSQLVAREVVEVRTERVADGESRLAVEPHPDRPAVADLRGDRAATGHPAGDEAGHEAAAEHRELVEWNDAAAQRVGVVDGDLGFERALA